MMILLLVLSVSGGLGLNIIIREVYFFAIEGLVWEGLCQKCQDGTLIFLGYLYTASYVSLQLRHILLLMIPIRVYLKCFLC